MPDVFIQNSGRELNQEYWDKLVNKVVLRCGSKLFLPYPVRAVAATIKSVRYIWEGIKCLAHGKIEVPVLDGTVRFWKNGHIKSQWATLQEACL